MSKSGFLSSSLFYTTGIAVGITMASALTYYFYKYIKRDIMPEKWRRVGILKELYLFPIKSCAPLKFDAKTEISCEILGLCLSGIRDRGFMILDENNQMITARTYPKMVLIQPEIIGVKQLLLTAENMEPLEIDLSTLSAEAPGIDVHTAVWDSALDAMVCGEKYDKWFSRAILNKEKGCRLVYYPYPKPIRPIVSRLSKLPFITRDDTGTFGDATSYMLMNINSINDLSSRIQDHIEPLQFRGNFYLKMDVDEPYAEDNWNWIKIGDNAIFRTVAPCTRCIFPNINVFTGERHPNSEPLKTLNSYRKFKKSGPAPFLGIHLGLRQPGLVKLNNVIYVEDK